MLDYKQTLQTKLNAVLPTYYELFVNGKENLPCITYIENNNTQSETGDSLMYSKISFTVKLWTKNVANIGTYCPQIDTALRTAGFRRVAYRELSVNTTVSAVMTYEATGQEGTSAWV